MTRRNIKKHGRNVIVYLTGSSLLYGACSIPEYNLLSQEYTQATFAPDRDNSVELLPLNIYLDGEHKEQINFIESFVERIISDLVFANEFKENPTRVLAEYNLEEIKLDEDSPEIQLILALTETEIMEAIKKQDVKSFLLLLKQKGFLQSEKVELLNKLFLDSENEVVTRANYQYMEDQEALMAICFVVALIYVGVGTVVETVVMAHSKFAMWGETRAQEYYVNRIIDQNILKLWVFADKPDVQTYNTVDKLYNDIIEVSHHFAEVMALSEETKDNLIRLGLGTLGKGTDTKNKKE